MSKVSDGNILVPLQSEENEARLGVDFSKHLYQPEQCEVTGEFIHKREDHNHVLKRITECLRSGEIPGVDVRHFVEALHDAESGE